LGFYVIFASSVWEPLIFSQTIQRAVSEETQTRNEMLPKNPEQSAA
jgi:hypothetical protein